MESSTPLHDTRYSLSEPTIEKEIENEIINTSVAMVPSYALTGYS